MLTDGSEIRFRQAELPDLSDIVRMLADDFLGVQRECFEDPLPESYVDAFREIGADVNTELVVAEIGGEVIGTLQLIFAPSISFRGGKRCTIESVRVDKKCRGRGIGREMMLWAIERAKAAGCVGIQLTTNNDRVDAHRFYEGLGFLKTSVGMKLKF